MTGQIYKLMLERIIIIALITLGYCCVFWEGMIFGGIGDWMERNAPEWLWKPLGGCYICACMWIGSIVYFILYGTPSDIFNVGVWLLSCIGAMGVNASISQFVDKRHKVEITDMPVHERMEIHPNGDVTIKIIDDDEKDKNKGDDFVYKTEVQWNLDNPEFLKHIIRNQKGSEGE